MRLLRSAFSFLIHIQFFFCFFFISLEPSFSHKFFAFTFYFTFTFSLLYFEVKWFYNTLFSLFLSQIFFKQFSMKRSKDCKYLKLTLFLLSLCSLLCFFWSSFLTLYLKIFFWNYSVYSHWPSLFLLFLYYYFFFF